MDANGRPTFRDVYDVIRDLRDDINVGLDRLDQRLAGVEQRLDVVEGQLIRAEGQRSGQRAVATLTRDTLALIVAGISAFAWLLNALSR